MNTLIAFTGLAGAGKSTVAEYLKRRLGYRRLSFAHPIREMLTACGLTHEQMALQKNQPVEWMGGKTPRQLMQTLGTEWGRTHVHPDVWVGLLRRVIERAFISGVPIVIDDCRFDNEARMIIGMGGIVVKVTRTGYAPVMNHPSEAGVSPELIALELTNEHADPAAFGAFAAEVLKARAQPAA